MNGAGTLLLAHRQHRAVGGKSKIEAVVLHLERTRLLTLGDIEDAERAIPEADGRRFAVGAHRGRHEALVAWQGEEQLAARHVPKVNHLVLRVLRADGEPFAVRRELVKPDSIVFRDFELARFGVPSPVPKVESAL